MEIKRVLLIVLTTFVFTALFIPLVKKIAEFMGAMDIPNERKVHKNPIPRMGGLGIYGGFLLGYMLFGQHSVQMNAILIGSFIILVTGIFDDIKPEYTSNDISYSQFLVTEKSYGEVHKQQFCFL